MFRRRDVWPAAKPDALFFYDDSLRMDASRDSCCAGGEDRQRDDRSCECFHGWMLPTPPLWHRPSPEDVIVITKRRFLRGG